MSTIHPLFSEQQLQIRVAELANEISEVYKNQSITALVVAKGALFFGTDLLRRISNSLTMEVISASSYQGCQSSGTVTLQWDPKKDLSGKNILIIEDILETGLTLNRIISTLEKQNPKSIKTCILLDKPSKHSSEQKADFIGFEISDEFVVGYGLDYQEKYRNLPYIGILQL